MMPAMPPVLAASAPPPDSLRKRRLSMRVMDDLPLLHLLGPAARDLSLGSLRARSGTSPPGPRGERRPASRRGRHFLGVGASLERIAGVHKHRVGERGAANPRTDEDHGLGPPAPAGYPVPLSPPHPLGEA